MTLPDGVTFAATIARGYYLRLWIDSEHIKAWFGGLPTTVPRRPKHRLFELSTAEPSSPSRQHLSIYTRSSWLVVIESDRSL